MPNARIIGGTHRSRKFETGTFEHTRPTKDRVKESMFNQLEPLKRFKNGLDVFAGVGSLGFEARSRGVLAVTLVEKDAATFTLLKTNTASLGLDVTLEKADALEFLTHHDGQYDLIILDPPYASDLLEQALALIKTFDLLTEEGLIIGLHEKPVIDPYYHVIKHRSLGRTQITLWEKP